ncbi:MAG: hypothetical protein K2J99_06175, partial [Lachnospiraceae bacterium]|nr:hypothetical protein [Lachnospiraceae bacterium]
MPEELELEEEEIPEELPEEPIGDFALDESLMPDELELEEELPGERESDDLALSDLGLDDLGLDDLGLEDAGQDDEDALAGGESLDDFALAESGEDDEELSALLAGMESDEDLAEINDLLEKADQGMSGDEDMLALLGDVSGADDTEGDFSLFGGEEAVEGEHENIREITPKELEERENSKGNKKEKKKAEKERKKKEKLAKKNKKKKGAQEEGGEGTSGDEDDELNSLLESMDVPEEKPKKQGFFAKILENLLEEDEEEMAAGEDGSEIGSLSDENKELLAELRAEDKKNAKKKEKKEKKEKKDKKDKKGAATEAKNKKPKKEKKKKEKKAEDEVKVPEKRLSKKKVITIFLFCGTVAACIIILSSLLPDQIEKQEARVAYDYGQYEQVYELLYGKKLSEEEDMLFQKSNIILQAKRKLESYENYRKLDMPLEAINALVEGVGLYQNLRDEAELYNISNELYDVYEQILAALTDSYGISESEALEILSAGDDVTYSQMLEAIVRGDVFSSDEESLPEVKQDILPEEEEIIDRLQDTESVEVNDEASQAEEDDTASQSQPEEIDEVMQAEEETLGE